MWSRLCRAIADELLHAVWAIFVLGVFARVAWLLLG